MKFSQFIPALEQALISSLPGIEAHKKMARFGRKFDFGHTDPPKIAGVMILLYPKGDTPHFVLIQRQGHPNDPHQHQISLPGGKKEPNEVITNTAIRETYEEIGVDTRDIQVLAPMSTVYVDASHFLIHPFIGFAKATPTFRPQLSEVKEILEIPISHLLDETRLKQKDITVRNYHLKDVPYFDLAEKIVWGATAMILSEFKEIVSLFEQPTNFR